MANPEETQDSSPPDGRPRRPPPTLDVDAVEMSSGSAAASAAAGSTSSVKKASGPLTRMAVIGSIAVIVAVGTGAAWIYLTTARLESEQHDTLVRETVKLDDMSARLAKLETASGAGAARPAPDLALANRMAALESAVMPLAERVADLERRTRDNTAAARGANERADTVASLLDELKKGGAERNALAQHEQSTLAGFADRLKALEALEAALKSKQEEIDHAVSAPPAEMPDRPVRVAVVAAALRNAVERDFPFTAELAAARALGLDDKALAALEPFAATGVPTPNTLFRDLSALVPDLLRVSTPAGHDGSYLDRLQASATKMMNIRPVGDVPGDDPATVISRIDLKMVRQDIVGVVAELDKLPAPAKELAQPWRKKSLARQAAIDAARRIAAASFVQLGERTAPEPSPR
jgi:hypothetical protein